MEWDDAKERRGCEGDEEGLYRPNTLMLGAIKRERGIYWSRQPFALHSKLFLARAVSPAASHALLATFCFLYSLPHLLPISSFCLVTHVPKIYLAHVPNFFIFYFFAFNLTRIRWRDCYLRTFSFTYFRNLEFNL